MKTRPLYWTIENSRQKETTDKPKTAIPTNPGLERGEKATSY